MELQEILEQSKVLRARYEEVERTTPYAKTMQKIDNFQKRINKLNSKIDKFKIRAEKQQEKHYQKLDSMPYWWGETILKPIGEELIKRNPALKHVYVIGPFGLNSETSLWFYNENGKVGKTEDIVASLTFHGDLTVWTGKMLHIYPSMSIGDLNGENKEMVKIVSIEQLNKLLQKSMQNKLKECC